MLLNGEYFGLKQKETQETQTNMLTNISFIEEVPSTYVNITTGAEASSTPTDTDRTQIEHLQLLSNGLLAALVITLIFLFLISLKRKNTHKYTESLKAKNKQIRCQNISLKKQTEDLKGINNMKDRLFSIVSHDLKDSISSIKALLDLLRDDTISKDEFEELIPHLSENATNASLLLHNLLNWSKSQLQNLKPQPELFNIREVFYEKMTLLEQKLQEKKVVLIDESQVEFIYADKSMVEIIIQNLMTNAIKFSRLGDVITISNKDHHGNSLMCIEDTGIGISEEHLNTLFQNTAFSTIGTQNEKGTGLGLTICKELVELNHGRIWAESTPNEGTKFFVELPKAKIKVDKNPEDRIMVSKMSLENCR